MGERILSRRRRRSVLSAPPEGGPPNAVGATAPASEGGREDAAGRRTSEAAVAHGRGLILTRRTFAERKTLAMLRDASVQASTFGRRSGGLPVPDDAGGRFELLRRAAVAAGMSVFSPATPFVSGDEHRLLVWLSAAQRAQVRLMPVDPVLAETVVRCADALSRLGWRLRVIA